MLIPITTKQFKKDVKKAKKQGKEIMKLKKVMKCLIDELSLPPQNKDHKLTGNYFHHRECHISPDWLLIYKATKISFEIEKHITQIK